MSTRCLIGYREKGEDEVTYCYCHFDGYPSGVGKTLIEHYNTPELAKKIASLHGFRSLENIIEKIEEYDDDWGYGKMSYEEYCHTDKYGVDYIYLYNCSCWTVKGTYFYGLEGIAERHLLEEF